ncbi:hypothetical protein B0H14DRAFT_3161689 [Mycena olivaceomarginata]|nr:hypothetical protein B0H14DRAFT_3161689 [Mycena olivaceomarginata]
MPPTLPTEVLEAVVDASRDNRTTVAACGAAARQLLVRSRVHLFANIFLGSPRANITRTKGSLHILYPSVPTRCDFLGELLEKNPSLARYVTGLVLSEAGHPSVTTYWISQSTTLVPVVRLLSSLRTFAIREGQRSEWSPVLKQAMNLCLHTPSLESVELSGLSVTELPSLFTIFATPHPGMMLQRLKLSALVLPGVSSGSGSIAQNEPSRMAVYTLDVSSIDSDFASNEPLIELFSKSPPLVNLSRLRHLRLSVDHIFLASRWVQLCATSLELLDLHLKSDDWPQFGAWEDDITLDQLLVFCFAVSSPGAMSTALRTLRVLRTPRLADITFSISLPDAELRTFVQDESHWTALDCLISTQTFPSLTTVRFKFDSSVPRDKWQPVLLRERLPILNNSGMLVLVAAGILRLLVSILDISSNVRLQLASFDFRVCPYCSSTRTHFRQGFGSSTCQAVPADSSPRVTLPWAELLARFSNFHPAHQEAVTDPILYTYDLPHPHLAVLIDTSEPHHLRMLFISFSIVALSLVYASPTPNGTSKNEASCLRSETRPSGKVCYSSDYQQCRNQWLVTDGALEADVQVAASGIDGLYGVVYFDRGAWVFNNRATHKWLSIDETTNRLVTAENLAPTVFAVDYAGGPGIQPVIKMPNADQVWQEVHTGSWSHIRIFVNLPATRSEDGTGRAETCARPKVAALEAFLEAGFMYMYSGRLKSRIGAFQGVFDDDDCSRNSIT